MNGWVTFLLLGISALGHAGGDELFDDQVTGFSLPMVPEGQATFSAGLFIDVPDAANSLSVIFDDPSGRDLILLLSDEPFPDASSLQTLFDAADYLSAGTGSEQFVTILSAANPPAAGTTWHIALIVFEGAASSATLTTDYSLDPIPNAQVTVDFDNLLDDPECDVAPWNDPEAFTPVAGNNASTLGEARRNAMLEAARIIGEQLFTPIPVVIRGCWENLGGEDGSAVLAAARSNIATINTPGVALTDTFYAHSVIQRMAGTLLCNLDASLDCQEQDIFIRFNTDVDGDALGDADFYYGLTDTSPVSEVDFLSTSLHEITHGLGFASFINVETGEVPQAQDGRQLGDAFTEMMVDNRSGTPVPMLDPATTDADRLAAITSGTGLQWAGAEAAVTVQNALATTGDGFVRLYAPSPVESGSSVSHIDPSSCALMEPADRNCPGFPFRQLGLERAMLHDVGWGTVGNRPPYLGLYLDRTRNGHGFEFQLGGFDPNIGPIYVLTFYSYENLGAAAEWFQAVGTISNGVFTGLRNGDGNGFPRFLFDGTRSPPQQADAGAFGQVVLSFNDPPGSVACSDGVNRGGASTLASFQWALGNSVGEWCVEPLVGPDTRPATDFGGLWFAGEADTGWGFSLENIAGPNGSVTLFVLLYVYAADGTPVWYFGLQENADLAGSVTLDMFQRTGFGRVAQSAALLDETAGSFTLTLTDPGAGLTGANRASVNVSYQGAEGGDWIRDDVSILRLSQPRD